MTCTLKIYLLFISFLEKIRRYIKNKLLLSQNILNKLDGALTVRSVSLNYSNRKRLQKIIVCKNSKVTHLKTFQVKAIKLRER